MTGWMFAIDRREINPIQTTFIQDKLLFKHILIIFWNALQLMSFYTDEEKSHNTLLAELRNKLNKT